MQFENVSYTIEPLEALSGFMHVIYEENNGNTHIPLFGQNDSYARIYDSESQLRSSLHVSVDSDFTCFV